ncbi:DNA-binding protein [Candidatus Roizmanbacteria bacterium CG_4_9_14_0_2_um_filter_39_13]|uniref:DNA-binding protein n=2 Tax=Candidatus Roizmaniibacteriota TaxID=1752723 RepID=A0A2M8EXP0_9BACT|nr:MAG: DNA-binding protein [Candidatus Roizmanbacteria bacterium CG_4_10_14_0_2_um_filter_39_12]PJC30830.1 MAG: DNA-binding protein [Candidatus Roizmanbacteria bacterium CG_4_9_14_0_2_um_filter_39_13]PJE62263.1 MAG: DNA-binding protein [Candidatus Roizmanbacteria bacterium CG10_big_fil_rev_8_21_14_0_10_39_12]
MTQDQYYTIEEVAKTLKVTYLTVYRWVRTKRLMALKAGKQYRISEENLSTFLKKYDAN